MAKKEEFISLKEAAKMSGYTPDYVGQLIRAGKLPGKQVFSNVAWVTTEEAMLEYVQRSKKGVSEDGTSLTQRVGEVFSEKNILILYSMVLWGVAVLLVVIAIFLMYVFMVSLDHRIEQSYLEKVSYAE